MSVSPPPLTRTPRGQRAGRWRWYYAAIADYRIAHPGCTNEDVAIHIRRHSQTVSQIVSTDMYREYEAQRLQAFRDQSDTDLRLRLTGVATQALESISIQIAKKQDQVPLQLATEIASMTLDRLGFAPQRGPQVVVNTGNQNVVLPNAVSPAALEEARAALRAVEQRRLSTPLVLDAPAEVEAELAIPEPEAPVGEVDGPDPGES